MERDGDTTRTLRVTLPAGVAQQPGVRITIDQGQPVARPYERCYANGCMADYESGAELVAQLKQGRTLLIEGVDAVGRPVTVTLPLTGFAEAYDGPSIEPQMFEEQQQIEEARNQEEARKRRMDAQCGTKP